ncbi:MAG: transcriptional regulator [Pseudaminobacter sp.]|nr:transcriptional regulator [Pseudaminobacter sp.]
MSVAKSEAERARAQYASLTRHYRAIGPAAIVAALLAAKKRKPANPTGKAA